MGVSINYVSPEGKGVVTKNSKISREGGAGLQDITCVYFLPQLEKRSN